MSRPVDRRTAATRDDPAFRRPLQPGEFEGDEWDDESDGDWNFIATEIKRKP